ncbi:hypothetical protein Taro_027279 [Colocasia esculenta]|uniref:Uncharacterized protein n=1 Tax=Colocasia esculenta TaxID=4460 RepID=A0A843VM24_COLES|nr:hypothetical protein [Colocasia esculenta]
MQFWSYYYIPLGRATEIRPDALPLARRWLPVVSAASFSLQLDTLRRDIWDFQALLAYKVLSKVVSTLLDSKVDSTSLPSKFLKNKLLVRSTLAESKVDTSCHPVNQFWRYSQEVYKVLSKVVSTLLDSKVGSISLPSKFLKNKLLVRSTLAESKVDTSCHPVN